MIAALDTTGPWVCAALGEGSQCLVQERCTAAANHNEILPELFSKLERRAGKGLAALAVNVGPGTFTGTRVGVSYVTGLAQALGLSVYTASSFRVAASLSAPGEVGVKVALPLVRGVWGVCDLAQSDDDWQELHSGELSIDELQRLVTGTQVIVPWGHLPGARTPPSDWNPAAVLLRMASSAAAGAFDAPLSVSVRYLGASQAERNFAVRRER